MKTIRIVTLMLVGLTAYSLGADKVTVTKTGVKMILLPGGTFSRGSKSGKADEMPVRSIKVDSFYIDIQEVTQSSFQTLTGFNPSNFPDPDGPVERVNWVDAVKYCNLRSIAEGLTPVYSQETWEANFEADGYRLPTEAEWEYAARAGSVADYFFAGGQRNLKYYAWYRENSRERTHAAASLRANPFGLFDMYGNVAEWCHDYYDSNYYENSPADNPRGPEAGKKRVIRGGSWADRPEKLSSTRRNSDLPTTPDICLGYDVYGFRVVRPLKTSVKSLD
jgi:sulfatase modifying factor 1